MGKLPILTVIVILAIVMYGCQPKDAGIDASIQPNDEPTGEPAPEPVPEQPSTVEPTPEPAEPYLTLERADWKNSKCQLADDECFKRNTEFNAACARIIYKTNTKHICNMFVNGVIQADDAVTFNDPDVPRVYTLYPIKEVFSLSENFYFFRDARIKLCCVSDADYARLRDWDYDYCKEITLKRLCD